MNILLSSSFKSFIELIGTLLIFLFVVIICYLTTRWMGGIQKARGNNKNLKVIETLGVGNNKTICLIEAGKKYLVVAIGKEEMSILTELEREDLKDFSFENDEGNTLGQDSFQEIFEKIKDKFPKNRSENE